MSLIKKPSELIIQNTIKVLIYGQPGIGKSTIALSAPAPLFLDFDNGVHRVNVLHRGDTVQINSWDDCLNVLKEDLTLYRTLVIDTAGKMLDYMSLYLIKNNPKLGKTNGALSLQGYGERKAEFVGFLKRASLMGKYLVFVAHDREEKDGDNKIIRPEIGGSSGGDLIKELDLVGYVEALGKKRTISFDPCEKFYGKNTCQLPSIMDLPVLTEGVPNDFLQGIFTSYQAVLEKNKETATEYNELIELIKKTINEATDGPSLNEKKDWAIKLQPIWGSKLVAGTLLNAKAKELGLTLNKETKNYEITVI